MRYLILALVVTLSACVVPDDSYLKGKRRDVTTHIRYTKDSRTGLCFAETGRRGYNEYAFTHVPCETRVNALIP